MDELEAKVKLILMDILDLEESQIDETTSAETIEAWDSVNHINIVLALENELGFSFEISEIEAMASFPKLMELVSSKV